jgi:hypothetical protein
VRPAQEAAADAHAAGAVRARGAAAEKANEKERAGKRGAREG